MPALDPFIVRTHVAYFSMEITIRPEKSRCTDTRLRATGWAIGDDGDGGSDGRHAIAPYEKLHETVLPLFHGDPGRWRWMMKQAIGNIAYYFNSQRMMRRYATEAYLR